MGYKDFFHIDATLVANEFLDKYMPSANGDYVKVYLFLLKNRESQVSVENVAEKLSLTEGDVRRALKYWNNLGILSLSGSGEAGVKDAAFGQSKHSKDAEKSGFSGESFEGSKLAVDTSIVSGGVAWQIDSLPGRNIAGGVSGTSGSSGISGKNSKTGVSKGGLSDAESGREELRSRYKRTEGKAALNRLSEDDEFKQLLFIVQKYMSRILTDSEASVFAYLYDGLGLPADVLDYLVQYCVEKGHNNTRYMEKTGIDWADHGIKTVKDAQNRTREFESRKSASAKKKASEKDKAGITRDRDLDKWLSDQMLRAMR